MNKEIHEQPVQWAQLLEEGKAEIHRIADEIQRRRPRFILFAARGTSDHAALYGKYLAEILCEKPAGLVSPSTTSIFGAETQSRDVLFVAVSQSGGSPDLLQSLEAARRSGAITLAVTNKQDSPLAQAAEFRINVMAGEERAVAATKSYTSQLLALYLLFSRLAGKDSSPAHILPDLAAETLGLEAQAVEAAHRLRFAQRLITTGRGYSYPTAREAALKLMETSYLSAQAFSAADLMHGPLAMIDSQVPVLAIATEGRGGLAMREVLSRLTELQAEVFCVGMNAAASNTSRGITLPSAPEELSPLLEILPFQQLALHLALERGVNPDLPRGLLKVTQTV